MHVPDLRKWSNDSNLVGLLLFAQVMEDMLFDYTIDSYKLPALNTHQRCLELLGVIDDVRSGKVRVENIHPMLEELLHSIASDHTIRSMLGSRFAAFMNGLNGNLKDSARKINDLNASKMIKRQEPQAESILHRGRKDYRYA